MISNVTKYVNSSRNTKKSKVATHYTPKTEGVFEDH